LYFGIDVSSLFAADDDAIGKIFLDLAP
jgi:hypothetical protein